MLFSVSSIRGSVGVTSWTLLLGAAWPGRLERIVLEADMAGGTLGHRYGLPSEPGVTSMLFDARLDGDRRPPDPVRHGRRLGAGVRVVAGPTTAEQAWPIWAAGGAIGAVGMASDRRIWLADCGRLVPDGPTGALVAEASVNLVVIDDRVAPSAVTTRLRRLVGHGRVGVIAVGGLGRLDRADWPAVDVWSVSRHRHLDEVVTRELAPRSRPRLGPHRSRAWREARVVAQRLADRLTERREQLAAEGVDGAAPAVAGGPTGSGATIRPSAEPVPPGRAMADGERLRPPDPPPSAYWPSLRSDGGGWTDG